MSDVAVASGSVDFVVPAQPLDNAAGRLGVGRCMGHHGEILQGAFLRGDGEVVHGLATLPCDTIHTTARFRPLRDECVHLRQVRDEGRPSLTKSVAAATFTLAHLGRPSWGGHLEISSTIPFGRGLGSSTADVVATIRAVADAFTEPLTPHDVARIAVRAESASDSIMFDLPVLLAQTEGSVLDTYSKPLPQVSVVGFDAAVAEERIDTLAMRRPVYRDEEREVFAVLRRGLDRAIRTDDSELLGDVASGSTRVQLRHRPNALLEHVVGSVGEWGALGLQVAHSGTVAGVITPLHDAEARARAEWELLRLTGRPSWSFDVAA